MSKELQERFEIFYKAYPRKVGKGQAEKTWKKLKPSDDDLDLMIEALEWQVKQEQWLDKKFIPHPSTWLTGKRWEDEMDTALMVKGKNVKDGSLSKSQEEELMKIQALKRMKMRGK